ncbi:hypothetical protein MTO96_003559 [Rhipicephalus appendiculatus]
MHPTHDVCPIASSGTSAAADSQQTAPSDSKIRQQSDAAASDREESGVETSGQRPYGAVKKLKSSTMTECCGFDTRLPQMETQVKKSPECRDIAVYISGSFPCLHIAIRGLKANRNYYLAIDFEEGMAGGEDKRTPEYTEPYYIPRPNHRQGARWMMTTWYFNLKTVFNGCLETFGCKLRERGEYIPAVRVHEYPEDKRYLSLWVTRIRLPSCAFIITSTRKPFTDRNRPEREVHLALKSDQVSSPPTVVQAQLAEPATPQPPPTPPTLSDSSGKPAHIRYRTSTPTPPSASEHLQNDPARVPNSPPPTADNSLLQWQLAAAQAKQASSRAPVSRGVHEGELELLLASPRAGGRRPSSGSTNAAPSIFSNVYLYEHSGDGDRGGVSECSQRKMATFGRRDFPSQLCRRPQRGEPGVPFYHGCFKRSRPATRRCCDAGMAAVTNSLQDDDAAVMPLRQLAQVPAFVQAQGLDWVGKQGCLGCWCCWPAAPTQLASDF